MCYKFAKHDAEKFGIIENVTDHEFYTNSYHIYVGEEINAFDKFKFESEFQPISSGGCISYVEIPNLEQNQPVVEKLITYIYDNVRYGEFNSKSDYCFACGFQGKIDLNNDNNWECPNCHNTNMQKMYVSRRTCGYLGSNEWNWGKRKEMKNRVEHL
jgi:ribonucleoside-triphosphate reductase